MTLLLGGHSHGRDVDLTGQRVSVRVPVQLVFRIEEFIDVTAPVNFKVDTYREGFISYQACNFFSNQRADKKIRVYILDGIPECRAVDLYVDASLKAFKPVRLATLFGYGYTRKLKRRSTE